MPSRTETDILLNIRCNYEEAVKRIADYKAMLEKVAVEQRNLDRELRQGAVSAGFHAQQTAALTQKQKYLKDQTRVLSREVQNSMRRDIEKSGSLVQLRARLSLLTRQYDEMGRAARNGSAGLAKLHEINVVTKEIKDAEAATLRFYRNVGNYQSALQGVKKLTENFGGLRSIITGIMGGLGAEQFMQNMMQTSRDFEDAIARVRAVANPFAGELTDMTDKARELGRTTRYTATEAAEGMEELARKGLTSKEVTEAITPTLQLAQANVVSISDAAQIATSTMRAFGKQATDLAHINDVMSSACSHSATNLNLLGEAMKTAGPTARAANIPLEETTALIGSLANVGMTGSDAGTGVKQLIMALATAAKGTDKQRAVLKKYNLEITETRIRSEGLLKIMQEMKESGIGESINDLKALAGKYASPRLANVVNNIDEAIALNKELRASVGENERMFKQSIGSTSEAVYMLRSAWESFMIDVWQSSSKYVVEPIKGITSALRFLQEQMGFVAQLVTSLLGAFMIKPIMTKMWQGMAETIRATGLEAGRVTDVVNTFGRESVGKFKKGSLAAMRFRSEVGEIRFAFQLLWAEIKGSSLGQAFATLGRWLAALGAGIKGLCAGVKNFAVLLATQPVVAAHKVGMAIRVSIAGGFAAARVGVAALMVGINGLRMAVFKVGMTLKSAIGALVPMLVITAIIEAAQATWNWYKGLSYVDDKIREIDQDATKAQHTDTIAQLEYIEQHIDGVHKRVLDTKKALDKTKAGTEANKKATEEYAKAISVEKNMIDQVNGILGEQYKTYADINTQLSERIKLLQKEAKTRAIQDAYSKQYGEIISLATKQGVTDFSGGVDKIVERATKDVLQHNTMGEAVGDFFGYENYLSRYRDINNAKRIFDSLSKSLTDDQKSAALGDRDKPGRVTPSGAYDDSDPETETEKKRRKAERERKKAEAEQNKLDAAMKFLEEQVKKYRKVYNDLMELNTTDVNSRARLDIKHTLEERMTDISTVLKVNERKIELLKQKGYEGKVQEFYDLLAQVETEARERYLRDTEKQARKEVSDHNKLIVEILSGMEAYTGVETVADIREMYRTRDAKRTAQMDVDKTALMDRYAKGDFGKTAVDYREEGDSGIKRYTAKRDDLEEKRGSGKIDDTEYKSRAEALNRQYAAEAAYYDMMQSLRMKYWQECVADERAQQEKIQAIAMQSLRNQCETLRRGFAEMANDRAGYYKNREFASADYWDRLKGRIGEQQAEELRMDYEQAALELQQLEERGRAKDEAEDEYRGKIEEAKSREVDVQTRANDAIQKSDEARFEAASQVTGGLISLTQALGDENKDMMRLSKMLTLAQIAIDTGSAISSTVKNAAKAGWPAMIPIIAGGIATVIANVATAISTVKSASFAEGGKVRGPGTATSDSIPARLSDGEYVMTASATRLFEPLLGTMNRIGAGVVPPRVTTAVRSDPAEGSELRDALTVALANVRPVVDVREVTRAQRRVEVIQNIGSR